MSSLFIIAGQIGVLLENTEAERNIQTADGSRRDPRETPG